MHGPAQLPDPRPAFVAPVPPARTGGRGRPGPPRERACRCRLRRSSPASSALFAARCRRGRDRRAPLPGTPRSCRARSPAESSACQPPPSQRPVRAAAPAVTSPAAAAAADPLLPDLIAPSIAAPDPGRRRCRWSSTSRRRLRPACCLTARALRTAIRIMTPQRLRKRERAATSRTVRNAHLVLTSPGHPDGFVAPRHADRAGVSIVTQSCAGYRWSDTHQPETCLEIHCWRPRICMPVPGSSRWSPGGTAVPSASGTQPQRRHGRRRIAGVHEDHAGFLLEEQICNADHRKQAAARRHDDPGLERGHQAYSDKRAGEE